MNRGSERKGAPGDDEHAGENETKILGTKRPAKQPEFEEESEVVKRIRKI